MNNTSETSATTVTPSLSIMSDTPRSPTPSVCAKPQGRVSAEGIASTPSPILRRDDVSPSAEASAEPPSSETDASDAADDDVGRIDDFDAMALQECVLRGIFRCGYERPSDIQARGIPAVLSGRDCIIQGRAGSGKTAAFAIGCLQQLPSPQPEFAELQVLVVSPTRELAQQTCDTFEALASYMKGIHARAIFGGKSVRDDIEALRGASVQVACGTHGRLLHLARAQALHLEGVRTVVFDEADVMLEGTFAEDARVLFTMLPPDVQAVLVSATITPNLLAVSRKLLRNPLQVRLAEHKISVSSIRHFFVDCGSDAAKVDVLLDLYECLSVAQTIIFVNRRDHAERLASVLDQNSFTVSVMHGEMEQAARIATLNAFREGTSRILLATDIVGRGIDVQQVSLVINFDLPVQLEDYIHRVGRSGRYGRRGAAISLLTDRDAMRKAEIQRRFHIDIKPLPQDVVEALG